MKMKIRRWRIFVLGVAVVATLTLPACGRSVAAGRRLIVLGFDGMDYGLARDLIAKGKLPNLAKLARMGSFTPLETTVPPQSPVAWSTFITGRDPGTHGIYDFIHRDPKTMVPYLSTTKTAEAGSTLKLGKYQIPLSGGSIELLRKGEAFWDVLEGRGVETTIIRMPANFPPSGAATRELSGMGTPDLIGTYGTFSFYTSNPDPYAGKNVSGGTVYTVDVIDNVVTGTLYGPDNPFLEEPEKVTADFNVYIDPEQPFVKIALGGEERVVKVGEWTDWMPFEFSLVPTQALSAEVRFYLKSVRPDFSLYAAPVNIDPMSPALPISTPQSYAAELAKKTGRYYTQGIPEDTKSLSAGIFTTDEFLQQARSVGEEHRRQYRYVLDQFDAGLLFYYFGGLDQISHMMWRASDPGHPAFRPESDARFAQVVEQVYVSFDALVGDTMKSMGSDTTLVVMSDHGFTSWRRAFHLNTWLAENGYLALKNPSQAGGPLFENVDWSKTRAYALGINGLYINVQGREQNGIVSPEARQGLAAEIAGKLLQVKDPATGQSAITRVYQREQAFKKIEHPDITPDLIVGYAKGTRGSNESALGEIPLQVFADNKDAWSGDHCMDPTAVPGVLFASRKLRKAAPSLQTLAAAILAEFDVEEFPRIDNEG